MAKHNDKAFNALLKEKFNGGFQKQFQNGLAQGTYAACKVMYDMATNETKTPEERIADIVRFSQTFLKRKLQESGADESGQEVKADADEGGNSES